MLTADLRALTPLSRIEPRVRLIAAVLLALTVLALDDLRLLGASVAAGVALVGAAELAPAVVLRRLLALDGLLLAVLAMLPFTTEGAVLFHLWGFAASREGLRDAAAILLTANAVLLVATALIAAQDARTLAQALHGLRVPAPLVHLLLLAGRYVAVLRQEQRRLRAAMRARAFTPRNGLRAWRGYGYLFGMLLVRGLERAERVLEAMKCRGFDGSVAAGPQTAVGAADAAFLAGVLAAAAGLLALEALA